jgi:hypothetical protein
LVYTGTHYDALRRGGVGGGHVLEGSPESLEAHGAAALALGERLRAAGAEEDADLADVLRKVAALKAAAGL